MRALLLWLALALPLSAGVTILWTPSPDADVTGYRLYIGTNSGAYPRSIWIAGGQTASNTVASSNFFASVTNFVTMTAVNSSGIESDFSNEIRFPVPSAPTGVKVSLFLESAPGPQGPWAVVDMLCYESTGPTNQFYRGRLASSLP